MFDLATVWDIPTNCAVSPLESGGYNNTLYRVEVSGCAPMVLRVYGNHANPKYIQHELAVLMQLQQRKLPFVVPAPILTRRGESYAVVNDGRTRKLMVLLPFIPGKNPPTDNLAQAEGAGEALAQLLNELREANTRGIPSPPSYNELGRVHPLVPDPLEAMNCLGSLAPKTTQIRIDAILEQVFDDAARIYRQMQQQLTHGDFINGNILMAGPRVTGVLDFEYCAMNPRSMDLAIALDTWSWDALNTGEEWSRIDSLGRGYSRVNKLSDAEISAMPSLILLRNASVLMHLIGRFLANLSPYVDVENWLDSMLQVDAWLTLNRKRLMDHARSW